MRTRLHLIAVLLALAAFALGAITSASAKNGTRPVDVELVLAVDVSYSMDPEEQRLQREGYFEALRSPLVLEAIRRGIHGKIAVAYVEWAGTASQEIVVDWTVIETRDDVERFIAGIHERPPRRFARTSISGVLDFATRMILDNDFEGLRQVIDVSGDGTNNHGRIVTAARDDAVAQGIVINGLPIMLNRNPTTYRDFEELDVYYTDCVIGGPGAFMVPIRERSQFPEATRTKLILEIAGLPVPRDDARIVPVQLKEPRVSCTIGERLWQERWGN
jgi:hypothetical protein